MQSPDCLYRISRDEPVICDDGKVFFLCLCNEKPVERVSVNVRQRFYSFKMCRSDRDTAETSFAAMHIKICYCEITSQFPEALLDGDFPERRDRIKTFFGIHDISQHHRQARVGPDVPYNGMGIKKVSHHIYSAKSSNGSSKSGAMYDILSLSAPY